MKKFSNWVFPETRLWVWDPYKVWQDWTYVTSKGSWLGFLTAELPLHYDSITYRSTPAHSHLTDHIIFTLLSACGFLFGLVTLLFFPRPIQCELFFFNITAWPVGLGFFLTPTRTWPTRIFFLFHLGPRIRFFYLRLKVNTANMECSTCNDDHLLTFLQMGRQILFLCWELWHSMMGLKTKYEKKTAMHSFA